jgi:hypothetical protein
VGASLLFDPASGLGFLYGGYSVGTDHADLWILDAREPDAPAWTLVEPAGAQPLPRSAHSAVWDAPRRRMVVHGGIQGEGGAVRYAGDTWAFYPFPEATTPTETPSPSTTTTPVEPTPDATTPVPSRSPEPDHEVYLPYTALRHDRAEPNRERS